MAAEKGFLFGFGLHSGRLIPAAVNQLIHCALKSAGGNQNDGHDDGKTEDDGRGDHHGLGGAALLIGQGKVAAASVNLLAKNPDHWAKGMILCITVEFYAILSLLASMMMLLSI